MGDVDLERGVVHVHRSIDRARGSTKSTKTGSPRRFNVEPAALPLLKKMHEVRTGDGVVLERMPRHRDLAEGLRTYLEVAGVERPELFTTDKTRKAITFHDLRATRLAWMAIRGDEPLRIMQRAGHESFATTQLYVREAEATGKVAEDRIPPMTLAMYSMLSEVDTPNRIIATAEPAIPMSSSHRRPSLSDQRPQIGAQTNCASA